MRRSQRIRLRDVHDVSVLANECLELWASPDEWRQHLVEGVALLTGFSLVSCEHRRISPQDQQGVVVGRASRGWTDDATRRLFHDAIDGKPGAEGMPRFEVAVQRLMKNGSVVAWRGDLVDEPHWLRTSFYQGVFEPAGIYDGMVSVRWDPRPGHFMTLALNQLQGETGFHLRHRRLLRYVHSEITPLLGTRLALEGQRSMAGLTSRRRETLHWLLEGLSEKETATRMHISPVTVHQYVGEIYQHFDVNSRAELMAYFVRRVPEPQTINHSR